MKKEDILALFPQMPDEDAEKILGLYAESVAELEAGADASEKALEEAYARGVKETEDKFFASERERLLAQALDNAGSKSVEALKALLKLEEITLEDGVLKGLDEQLLKLRTECSFLFEEDENKPRFTAESQKNGDAFDISKLGYRERLKLFKDDPELYKELVTQ